MQVLKKGPDGIDVPPGASGSPGAASREFRLVFIGLMVAMLLSALDMTIVQTALPHIVGEFSGLEKFAWVTTAYVVTSSIANLVFGKMSDQFGRRPIFMLSIIVFLVGSLLCGVAQSMTQLILFRAIQGLGGGGIMSLNFVIIGDYVAPRDRGKYFGFFTGTFALSSVAGPLIGGVIVDNTSWRWIFLLNLPLGAITLFIVSTVMRMPVVGTRGRFDAKGAILVSGAICALMVALEEGGHRGWRSPTIIALFALACVLAALFVRQQRRASEPLMPLRMFREPLLRKIFVLSILVGATMKSSGIFFGLFFQDVRFYSPTKAGMAMLPMMLGTFAASTTSGRLISRWGRYRVFGLVGIPLSVIGMAIARTLDVDQPYVVLGVAMFLMGLGMGSTMPMLSISVQNAGDPRDLGIVTSSHNFFRSLGSSCGMAVNNAIFVAVLTHQLDRRLPPDADRDNMLKLVRSPEQIRTLPESWQQALHHSITIGTARVLLLMIAVSVVAYALAWIVEEIPLRQTTGFEARALAVE